MPNTWAVTAIGDVATLSPKTDTSEIGDDAPVHFIPMAAVSENFGGLDISRLRPFAEVRKGYTSFNEGDVLFAKITPCMENGKGGLVSSLPHMRGFGSTEFHVLKPSRALLPKWLAHYLAQPDFRKVARHNMTGTAGQLRVPSNWLVAAGIPIAPISEQTRIVEKLEELLSDLDAGVAELKAAQKKLRQYRQSLLKAAVEGALTAEWRKQRQAHPLPKPSPLKGEGLKPGSGIAPAPLPPRGGGAGGEGESGAQLLQRILAERRARWEAKQRAKFAEQGKPPPTDWQKKYPEPVPPDTSGLPELPEGWVWASIEQVASDERYSLSIGPFGSNLKVPDYRDAGVPLVFVRNIRSGNYGGRHTKYVTTEKAKELGAHGIAAGDVLITKMGEPPGDAAVYPDSQPPAIITADCIKVRCWPGLIRPSFLKTVVNSCIGKRQVEPMTQGVAQKKVSLGRFARLAVPIPSIEEQDQLMTLVGRENAEAVAQELAIERSLKQSAAQRKNILKAAFSGQLVPQDPNDEPASVLLERIRAERAERVLVKKPSVPKSKEIC